MWIIEKMTVKNDIAVCGKCGSKSEYIKKQKEK